MSEDVRRAHGTGNGRCFAVGDAVVSPHHGVGTVVEQGVRALGGARREYFTIEIERRAVKLFVPSDRTAQARLRPLASRADARRALDVLSAPPQGLPANWRERQKETMRRLGSGELLLVAELVRDFAHAAQAKRPATTDRELYDKSRGLLEDELRAVLGMSASRTAAAIDRRLPAGAARCRG